MNRLMAVLLVVLSPVIICAATASITMALKEHGMDRVMLFCVSLIWAVLFVFFLGMAREIWRFDS